MKTNISMLLAGLLLVTGCASPYVVKLNNGTTFMSKGKPHLDKAKNRYVFTDTSGQKQEISPGLVREIAPESMQDTSSSSFKSTPQK